MAETGSKSIHNWRRYPSSKCYEIDENVRFGIWRVAVSPSDAAEKPQYECSTTVPHVHNNYKDILENVFLVWLLVCTHLFVPSHFCTTCMNFDNYCQRHIATGRKKLYSCTSTFSALNYCNRIFFKSLSYLYEVVRTKFSADVWTFRNFPPQFDENRGATWQWK